MNSTKPYLVRGFYEWCCDNNLSAYIIVRECSEIECMKEYFKSGKVTLNISNASVRDLVITNEHISCRARFGGVSRSIEIPMSVVTYIFAKENGHALSFPEEEKSINTEVNVTGQTTKITKPTLKLIK